jgi:hypothetical protein
MKTKKRHPDPKSKKILVKKKRIGKQLKPSSFTVYLYEPNGDPLIDNGLKSESERVVITHQTMNKYELDVKVFAKKDENSGSFTILDKVSDYKIGHFPRRKIFVKRSNGFIQQLDVEVNTPAKKSGVNNSGYGEKKDEDGKAPQLLSSVGNDYQIFIINRNSSGIAISVYLNRDNPAVRAIGVWKGEESPLRNKCRKYMQNCINLARQKNDDFCVNLSSLDNLKNDHLFKNIDVNLVDIYGTGADAVKNYMIDHFLGDLFYKNQRKEYSPDVSKLVSEIQKFNSRAAFLYEEEQAKLAENHS